MFSSRPLLVKRILWLCVLLTFGIFGSISYAFIRQDREKTPDEIYQTYRELAVFDAEWGRMEDAFRFFEKAKMMREPEPAFKKELAFTIVQQGLVMKKRELVERALAIDPDSLDARFALGIFSYYENRLDRALEEFKRVAELNPNYPGVQNNLAAVYEKMGEREKALYHYRLSQGVK
jgi:tetratricopeptide (TPR) repeat protein